MKVGLNVIERGVLLNTLPKEGNFLTLRVIRNLVDKVGFSAQEMKDFEIKRIPDERDPTKIQTSWNLKGAAPTEIDFADVEVDIIKKQLNELDTKQKLTLELFSVYEKFCT